jgi:hypothetical protein
MVRWMGLAALTAADDVRARSRGHPQSHRACVLEPGVAYGQL